MDRSEANEVDRHERSVREAERGKGRWAKERKKGGTDIDSTRS